MNQIQKRLDGLQQICANFTSSLNYEAFQGPLRYIIRAVAPRMEQAKALDDCIPEYERELEWRRIRSSVEYVFWAAEQGKGERDYKTKEKEKLELDRWSTKILESLHMTVNTGEDPTVTREMVEEEEEQTLEVN